MKYAPLEKTVLSIENNDITYTKECYLTPLVISGVIDEDYPNYDANATYNTGSYVIVPELKTIYKCADDDVSGIFPPSDKTKFQDRGFINSYRMFSVDTGIGAVTVGENITMEFTFDTLDTLGLIDVDFISLDVEQIDTSTNTRVGEVITVSGKDYGVDDIVQYFYSKVGEKTRVILDDLEWLPTSKIKLTFTGEVSIGTLVLGLNENLFFTLFDTELTFEGRSQIKVDEYTGHREIIRHGHVRVLRAGARIDVPNFNTLCQIIPKIIDKNVLFIPTQIDDFNEMNNIAYIERFPIPVNTSKVILTKVIMIGVSK